MSSPHSLPTVCGAKAPFFEGRISFGHLAEVTAENASTVVFRTRTPDVVMPHRLAAYAGWIGSARYMASAGLDGMRTRSLGSGPYRVSRFQRDQRVVLDAFDDYWMGKPPARRVVFTAVAEASVRLAGLQAGDFDIVTNLLPDQAPALAKHAKVEAVSVPMDLVHILYFDTREVRHDAHYRGFAELKGHGRYRYLRVMPPCPPAAWQTRLRSPASSTSSSVSAKPTV